MDYGRLFPMLGSAGDLERELREAAAIGEPLQLGDRPDQRIHAELLYRALAGDWAPVPRAVKLLEAHVVGPLNLEAATLRCPLRLDRCRFSEHVTLNEAAAPSIRLIACTLTSLDADQLQTRGDFDLSDSVIDGALRMRGAHIGGNLNFQGATLRNPGGRALDGDGLRVEQSALFQGLFVEGGVYVPRARVGGRLNFDGAKLTGAETALRGDLLRVEQGMFCRRDVSGYDFSAEGEVRLPRAQIGGQLSFRGATLLNPDGTALYAHGISVDQSMRCDDSFSAEGKIVLLGATIGGQLFFSGATLRAPDGTALAAERLRVDLNVLCNNGFRTEGSVVMRGARVGGDLSFSGARLDSDADPGLDLEGVEARILDLQLAAMPTAILGLRDARVGRLRDKLYPPEGVWPRCRLDGFRYETLEACSAVSEDQRLAWLARDPDHYAPQPYEQLATVYAAHGDDAAARRVAIEKQRRRRRLLPWPGRVWSWFLGGTVGHGYRLWLAGVWLLVLVVLGSVLFGAVFEAGAQPSNDLHPAGPADEVPRFQPIIYTADALVPVLDLGQEGAWNANGAAQWVSAIFTTVGWLLTTALLAGIAARRQ